MKFSRNPSTGVVEVYTDEGIYVGVMASVNEGEPKSFAQDGGPGSGNWGHAGRPGKVGGSQKGGGGQYRGGKAEVGYFGSRKDWLNGLSGEEQHKAVRFIAEKKREFESALEAKKKVESDIKDGRVSEGTGKGIIDMLGVNGMDEKTPVEAYILQKGGERDINTLLLYSSEARNWDKNKDRMISENLTEEEQRVLDYTKDKNYATNFQEWKVYRNLLAKACGIPHPDIEIPDEIMYESGAKDRPDTKYGWYRDLRNKTYSSMEGDMNYVIGNTYGYGRRLTAEEFEELNKQFVDTMRYGKLSPIKCRLSLKAIGGMRAVMSTTKDDRNDFYYKGELKITPEMVSRLDETEREKLLGLINSANDNMFNPVDKYSRLEDVDDVGFDTVENSLQAMALRTKEDQQVVRDYVLAMEKMLTDEVPSDVDFTELEKKIKKEAEEKKRKAFIEQRDKEQKEFVERDGARIKRATIEKIKKITPESVEGLTREGVAELVYNTGIMRTGSQFVTSQLIPNEAYRGAVLAYRDVIEKYPFLAGELGGFGDNLKQGNAVAGCCMDAFRSYDRTELCINYSDFSSKESLWQRHKKAMDKKWYVRVDEGLPMGYPECAHELGHALSNWLHRFTIGEFHGIEYSNGFRSGYYYDNEVATLLKKRTLSACGISGYNQIRDGLSEYGAASRHNKEAGQAKSNSAADEFFAEAFCELMCSSNPRPIALEFGRQLDKFIKENNITADSSATTPVTMPKFDKR